MSTGRGTLRRIRSGHRRPARTFAYEWHDDPGNWFRSYGTRTGSSTSTGSLRRRLASINDLPISATGRKYDWPLGRRPDDHPTLSELGL